MKKALLKLVSNTAHISCEMLGRAHFGLGIRCAALVGRLTQAVLNRPSVSQLESLLGPRPGFDYLSAAKDIAANLRQNEVLRAITFTRGVEWLSRQLTVKSGERISAAREAGPVLLVGLHFGFQYGLTSSLHKLGIPYTVLHEDVPRIPVGLSHLKVGSDPRQNSKAVRELARRMKKGEVGVVLTDGGSGQNNGTATMFGREFKVPLGAGLLQNLTRARVIPTVGTWEGNPPRPVAMFCEPLCGTGDKADREQLVRDTFAWAETLMRNDPSIIRGHRIAGYLRRPPVRTVDSAETT